MNPSDVVVVAAFVLTAFVPFAVVCLVALLRGYTIHLSVWRPPRSGRRGGRRGGD